MASTAIDIESNLHNLQHRRSSSSYDEKDPGRETVKEAEQVIIHDATKPFPIEDDEVEETHQLTFRALLVGCCLGAIVGASNIYLGLKSGITFGPQLFGAIFGFAIIKPLSKALPESGILGYLFGGPFGPKENCTIQSAATAAGGLGVLFVSAVPAMYFLRLLSESPEQDVGKLIALTVTAGFFGVFFVIPLRRYYIIKQKLAFPTPAATAFTIHALHHGTNAIIAARKKTVGLVVSMLAAFTWKVLGLYAPGITFDWHIGWTLYRLGFTSIIALDNYGWWIEFTPAFFGAGMLSGLNASWSFFGGSFLAWGIIAPSIVSTGEAVGKTISTEYHRVSYLNLGLSSHPVQLIEPPSPRYWLIWPGVFIMFVYSFTDVFLNILPSLIQLAKSGLHVDWRNLHKRGELQEDDEDQTPMEDRVPTLWWTGGLVISTIVSVVILSTMFHFNIGEAILALILGFLFSFIGVQSAGQTDVNPVSTVAKASQLVFGGIAKTTGFATGPAQIFNLSAGVVSAGSAAQATDMTGDLKTGYLLRAKPKNQFIAQLVGSLVAVFLNVGLFILFTKTSKCIIYPDQYDYCTYNAPSVAAWAITAVAVTSPKLPISPSSGYTAVGLGVAAVLTVVAKHYWIPKKYHGYIPNWNAIGLGFVLPQTYFSIAMSVGSVTNAIWFKRSPTSFDMYMFPIAAGLLAGEGLAGVFGALLTIANIGGNRYGTAIGCPGFEFCG